MRLRVVCGFGLTILTLEPSKAFNSVDFPTFGRPTSAAIPHRTGVLGTVDSPCGLTSGNRQPTAAAAVLLRPAQHDDGSSLRRGPRVRAASPPSTRRTLARAAR